MNRLTDRATRRGRPRGRIILAVMVSMLVLASPAVASTGPSLATPWTVAPPQVTMDVHTPGLGLTERQVMRAALDAPSVARLVVRYRPVSVRAASDPIKDLWFVSLYHRAVLVATARLDGSNGRLLALSSGASAAAAGNLPLDSPINVWWLMVPLCLGFFLPFFDWRRPFRLVHFDLLALLGFAVLEMLATAGQVNSPGIVNYLLLAYLGARALLLGFRPRTRNDPLVPMVSIRWLVAGIVVFMALRIGLAIGDPSMWDVGGASVVGAHDLTHGISVYGGTLNAQVYGGDTYGPFTYLAYVPFESIFPWHPGAAPPYPAGLAAAIVFDLLVLLGLILLGRRLRTGAEGNRLGVTLAYAWATFPPAALVVTAAFNDSLVAALVVFSLVFAASPVRRGALAALAAVAKFFPFALVPLLATSTGPRSRRSWIGFGLAFAVVTALCVLPLLPPGGPHQIYTRTLGYQLHRGAPTLVWTHSEILRLLRYAFIGVTLLFAASLAFWPKKRGLSQVVALAAAVVIAIEIPMGYWFYSYLVWFTPLLLAASFFQHERAFATREAAELALRPSPHGTADPEPEYALA